MLDAWIIEKLKKEEEAEREEQERQRPQLELPLPPPDWKPEEKQPEEPKRGVLVIQLG